MTRVHTRARTTRQRARRPATHEPTHGRPAHAQVDPLVLQLQRMVGNRAVQGLMAARALDGRAVQLQPRIVPVESLTTREREKYGAAQQRAAVKGIRRLIKALRRSAKGRPTAGNQWRLAHAVTILRKYLVSGDMISCYNALVKRLRLPGRRLASIRFIGSHGPKQASTVEKWWENVGADFRTLGQQLRALGYSARFTKTVRSKSLGKLPLVAYFRTPEGTIIGPITWRQMVPTMRFLIQKQNRWAATPEDFVWSVLKSNMALTTRVRKALWLWSTNRLKDDRYMTRANVSTVTKTDDWKLGSVPDAMTSFADKIHAAWSLASSYSRKSGPSKSRFIKEMEKVHAEVVDGIKAIISGGHTIFYAVSNKQFKLVDRLKRKAGTVLYYLHKY
jgi:hypothetical protein